MPRLNSDRTFSVVFSAKHVQSMSFLLQFCLLLMM